MVVVGVAGAGGECRAAAVSGAGWVGTGDGAMGSVATTSGVRVGTKLDTGLGVHVTVGSAPALSVARLRATLWVDCISGLG
jgi:hypothetical protein